MRPLLRQLRGGGVVPKEFVALGHLLHDLRLYKSRAELKLMRASAAIAAEAHVAAMALARAGRHEYEVEAELLRVMRTTRRRSPAFPHPSSPAASMPAPCITKPIERP